MCLIYELTLVLYLFPMIIIYAQMNEYVVTSDSITVDINDCQMNKHDGLDLLETITNLVSKEIKLNSIKKPYVILYIMAIGKGKSMKCYKIVTRLDLKPYILSEIVKSFNTKPYKNEIGCHYTIRLKIKLRNRFD